MLELGERIRATGLIDNLGVRWETEREAGNFDAASEILKHYQSLVLWLMSTGFNDYLPDGAELPDEFMPKEYLEMLKTVQVDLNDKNL